MTSARPRRGRGSGGARAAFRRWRRERPFWGGFFAILGGVELLSLPLAPLALVIHQGIAGVSGILMGLLMILMGLVMWFQPHLRSIAGIATVLFSLTSFVTSNFGGFLLGMLLGIIGGSLGFAWAPRPEPTAPAADGGPEPTTAEAHDDTSLSDSLLGEHPGADDHHGRWAPDNGAHPDRDYPEPNHPDQPVPDQVHSGQAYPDQIYPDQVYPDQPYPGRPHPDRPYPERPPGDQPQSSHRYGGGQMLALAAVPLFAVALGVLPSGSVAASSQGMPASVQQEEEGDGCPFFWPDCPWGQTTPAPTPNPTGSPTPGVTPTPGGTPTPGSSPTPGVPDPTGSPTPGAPGVPGAPGATPTPGVPTPPPVPPECKVVPKDLPTKPPKPGSEAAKRLAEQLKPCFETPVKVAAVGDNDTPIAATAQCVLTAKSLTMTGLDFNGVVAVPTKDGAIRALDFTMDGLTINGLEQTSTFGKNTLTVKSIPGESRLEGNVSLQVTKMSAKLLGLIPVTFTPDSPPPLTLPVLYFTDVTSVNVYARADVLRLPKLDETVS